MLNDRKRSAHVVASRDTRCLEIPYDALEGSVKTKLVANLAAHLARKVVRDTELLQPIWQWPCPRGGVCEGYGAKVAARAWVWRLGWEPGGIPVDDADPAGLKSGQRTER